MHTALPVYLQTAANGRLAEKEKAAAQQLAACRMCPRRCNANRLSGSLGVCRTGRRAVVAAFQPHFGEERPLVGQHGSGTIFFGHCSLGCNFCQNWDISHHGDGRKVSTAQLADIMLHLQQQGCRNINLVTPSHVVPQILKALALAIPEGLKVPLVYNSSGYDRVQTLKLLEGVVDIYMPDFKFWDSKVAQETCQAPDYPEVAQRALLEMHRQVGILKTEPDGLAWQGLLVRHLVLPENMAGTADVMQFIGRKLSPQTYVNLMAQYRPCGRAADVAAMARRPTAEELEQAMQAARRAGLKRLDTPRRRFMVY